MKLYELFEDWKSDLHVVKNLTRSRYDDDSQLKEPVQPVTTTTNAQPSKPAGGFPEGQILVVRAPSGAEYFKSYKGNWYELLDKSGTEFSVTHPISAKKDIAALEQLEDQGTIVYVKPSMAINGVFVLDPVAEKKAKLTALRKKPK